jgi:Prophage minor tail protein Z (GPZ)
MLTIDMRGAEAMAERLGVVKAKVPKAMSLSINHAIRRGRTEVSKAVRAEFQIKQKDLYAGLKTNFSSPGELKGSIESKHAGMIRSWDFKVAPRAVTNPALGPGSGRVRRRRRTARRAVTVAVRVGGGKTVSSGFVAIMRRGISLFQRVEPGRFGIREMFAINAPIMLNAERVRNPVEAKMGEDLDKELERQLQRLV